MNKHIRILLLCSILFLVACGKEIEATMDSEVDDFAATTQDGKDLSNKDLEGQWWIADFIFTNCTTVCLPMTSNMSKLQDQIKEADLAENVQLVSFSVDPDYDTPEVLTEYAQQYDADLTNWTFLTGYDFETIQKISVESFQSALAPPPEGDDQVMHGTRFFLVNPEGVVIKSYKGTEANTIDEIVDDLKIALK